MVVFTFDLVQKLEAALSSDRDTEATLKVCISNYCSY